MTMTIQALINLFDAFVLAGLGIPLILRKVPMNHFYGVRFRQSFQTEKNWYEINAIGGRLLLLWSLPILLLGLAGFVWPVNGTVKYALVSVGVTVGCVLMACLQSYWAARSMDMG